MRATRVEIDLDALKWNLDLIRKRVGSKNVIAMVKANAYGHGMITVARTLQMLGIDMLGVAYVDEAITLRSANITVPIIMLTPNEAHESETLVENDCIAVICSEEQAQQINSAAQRSGKTVKVHLYIDTGMHREGFHHSTASDAASFVKGLSNLHVDGACTHFATADEVDTAYLKMQHELFHTAVRAISSVGCELTYIHAANTGAIFKKTDAHFSAVRPGLALYGYISDVELNAGLKIVMSIHTSVIAMRTIQKGESVSYGRRFIAERTTRVATIPIGYGDGFTRRQLGRAYVIIRGQKLPVIGTICMDECMVDVTDTEVQLGDLVTILGSQNGVAVTAKDLAEWSDTIPYEITTAVSGRVPRIFTGSTWRELQSYMDNNV